MNKIFLSAVLFFAGVVCSHAQRTGNVLAEPLPVGYEDLNATSFELKMKDRGVVLLDVRTPEETALGKIEGATELDFFSPDFEAEIDKLDKNKTYLIYCRSGKRSGKTCALMAQKGFKHLFNLAGGYNAWEENRE